MKHRRAIGCVLALLGFVISSASLAKEAEQHGITLDILQEEVVDAAGGKYRMRATEFPIARGRALNTSQGLGGVVYVLQGALTPDKGQPVTMGQSFKLSSENRYTNTADDSTRVIVFEVLPLAQEKPGPKDGKEIKLDKEIGVMGGENKMILVHGKIARGGYAGEHIHRGSEIRVMLSGSLTMDMPNEKEVHKKGDYFFEPAHAHMMKVEGDKNKDTSFIIFEVGRPSDLDAVYRAKGRE